MKSNRELLNQLQQLPLFGGYNVMNMKKITQICLAGVIGLGFTVNANANTFDLTTLTSGKTITIVEAEQNYDAGGQGPVDPIAQGLNTVPFDGIDRQIVFDGQTGWIANDMWAGRSTWTGGGLLEDGIWHSDHNNNHGNNAPRITTTITGLDAGLYETYVVYVSDLRTNGGGMIMARLNDPTDTASLMTYGSETNLLGLVRGEDTGLAATGGWNVQVAKLGITENATSLSIDVDNNPNRIGIAARNLYVGIGYRKLSQLTLEINTTTGATMLKNESGLDIDFDYYSIISQDGSFDIGGWNSLQDQGAGTVDEGDDWEEMGVPTANDLTEGFLTGDMLFADQATAIDLGNAFSPLASEDVVFTYRQSDGTLLPGIVTYVQGGVILGDVNGDGLVNGFDVDPFVDVLLNGPYQIEADVNEDGAVNGFDVDPFVALVLGGGSAPEGTQVPEPATLVLLGLGGLAALHRRKKY